jgi:hypothetical protein
MVFMNAVKMWARGIEPWPAIFCLMRRLKSRSLGKRQNLNLLTGESNGPLLHLTVALLTGALLMWDFLHASHADHSEGVAVPCGVC